MDKAELIIRQLDSFGRKRNEEEYGLPIEVCMKEMIEIVSDIISTDETKKIVYDLTAKKCGWNDFEHMKINEEHIDKKVLILFNEVCYIKRVSEPFKL